MSRQFDSFQMLCHSMDLIPRHVATDLKSTIQTWSAIDLASLTTSLNLMLQKTQSWNWDWRQCLCFKIPEIGASVFFYCTILYYTILYYTILYYTILYYTILYYTILYYTILYCDLKLVYSGMKEGPDGHASFLKITVRGRSRSESWLHFEFSASHHSSPLFPSIITFN